MGLQLQELSVKAYAERILPMTHELWGRGRSLEAYVKRTHELASCAYSKRYYRNVALTDSGGAVLSSHRRYERTAKVESRQLRAIGIGAVFTAPDQRGHGYASAMLGLTLDQARRDGFDFAYLFSDIHPQFYRELGFVDLPSRSISVRADSLESARMQAEPVTLRDWHAIRACYDDTMAARTWGFTRPAPYWSWVRTMLESESSTAQRVNLLQRGARGVAAYVLGRREPKHDSFVVDEFGFSDEHAKITLPALLRFGAGDLRRVVGWLPPVPARNVLPRGSVRSRSDAIFMAAALNDAGRLFIERALEKSTGDCLWSTDHI